MTVKEIIEQLKEVPEDLPVVVRIPHCCGQSGGTEKSWFFGKVVKLKLKKLEQEDPWLPSYETSENGEEDVIAIASSSDNY